MVHDKDDGDNSDGVGDGAGDEWEGGWEWMSEHWTGDRARGGMRNGRQ